MNSIPIQDPTRQSALPSPRYTIGMGNGGMQGLYTGRVTYVDWTKLTVDVFLDSGAVLHDVPVITSDSGPDRAHDELPRKRSAVLVQFCYGLKDKPVVMGALRRTGSKSIPGSGTPQSRRVYPNGMHEIVHDDGTLEMQFADGSQLVIGSTAAIAENHVAQSREADNGDPFKEPGPVSGKKADPFQFTLKMADGTTFSVKGGTATLTLPKDLALNVSGDLNAQVSGNAKIAAASVEVDGPSTFNGNMTVKGTITSTGNMNAPDFSTGVITLLHHQHPNGNWGSPTGDPIPG